MKGHHRAHVDYRCRVEVAVTPGWKVGSKVASESSDGKVTLDIALVRRFCINSALLRVLMAQQLEIVASASS